MIKRFKELADRRTNHAEDEFAGSPVDAQVAGATTQLADANLDDEHSNEADKQ